MKLLAVDPGEVHVGLAAFEFGKDADGDDYADCTRAWELDPETAIDTVAAGLLHHEFDVLVVEEFRLYPDKAKQQTGSTMPTCELIGQIKWAHRLDSSRRYRAFCEADDALDRWDDEGKAKRGPKYKELLLARGRNQNPVDLVLQPAAIQEPTQGVLRKRGIKSVAKRDRAAIRQAWADAGRPPVNSVGDHALSAELHGWHYLIRVWKGAAE